MSIRNSQADRLQRLRWKLTLSYTGVTLGTLLAVGLVFVGVSIVLLVGLTNSSVLRTRIIETAAVEYTPALRRYLVESPPDVEGISAWMERFERTSTILQLSGTIPIRISEREFEVLVVGSDRRLLGVTSSSLLDNGMIGEPLDTQAIPGLEDPLQAALAGEEDTERLYTLVESDRRIVMAVPIRDVGNERVLGVLVLSIMAPTTASVLSDLAPILGVIFLSFTLVAGLVGTAFGFLTARGLVKRLNRLAEATIAWRQGNFDLLVDDSSKDELGQLARRLNYMAQQLQHLLDTRRELAVLEERNRLARDLHDSAKQQAFAAGAQISAARTLLKHDPESAEAHIEEAELLVYNLRQELGSFIQELRPAALEGKGLATAVREYATDWSRQNGIELEARVQGEMSLPLDIEQEVFRIVQESLANVARHSKARKADIELTYTGGDISCIVTDDGVGFDPNQKYGGFGLSSMQERTNALGGNLTVESVLGQGTRITLSVPVRESQDDKETLHE